MNNFHRSLLCTCLFAVAASSLPAQEIVYPNTVVSKQAAISDSVLYGVLFRHVIDFKAKADELDQKGQNVLPIVDTLRPS